LAELGNSTRFRLFRLLVKAGPVGATIGEAHHFQALLNAGLIGPGAARSGRDMHGGFSGGAGVG